MALARTSFSVVCSVDLPLVKARHEKRVHKLGVENGHAHNPADKVKVGQMVVIDARVGADLERVVVIGAVLEQAAAEQNRLARTTFILVVVPVVGIEHLLGEKVEPLARQTTIVEAILAVKADPHSPLEIHGANVAQGGERVLKDTGASNADLHFAGHVDLERGILAQLDQLGLVIANVLWRDLWRDDAQLAVASFDFS